MYKIVKKGTSYKVCDCMEWDLVLLVFRKCELRAGWDHIHARVWWICSGLSTPEVPAISQELYPRSFPSRSIQKTGKVLRRNGIGRSIHPSEERIGSGGWIFTTARCFYWDKSALDYFKRERKTCQQIGRRSLSLHWQTHSYSTDGPRDQRSQDW